MRMYDIIRKKREGGELTDREIFFFVKGCTDGSIPDYQSAALCMAICFRGMTHRETAMLTECMAHSGDTVDLSCFGNLSVDKHSTGGVGDKTSLVVAPIVACLGGKVAKMSGRGLGHTGGTVDKLESIPGLRTVLTMEEFIAQVEKVGMAIIGQTGNLAPADKKLYALRDVTATVDSIPLIVSSVMSKKLAAGARSIVLDVKVGSGAFMKTQEEARALASDMVAIGNACGRNMTALVTDMDTPLGYAVGNALEVKEVVRLLQGQEEGDLKEICIALAAEMTALAKEISVIEAKRQVEEALRSGKAYEKMKEWVKAQGGDCSYIDHLEKFPKASVISPVFCPQDGYISSMNAERIGNAAVVLGAGRISKDAGIDHAAGIVLKKKTGDEVRRGEVLCFLHTNDRTALRDAEMRCLSALTFCREKPAKRPLVYEIIR